MSWAARLAWATPTLAFVARCFFVLVSPIWSPLAFLLRTRRWLWLQHYTHLVPASTLARAEGRLGPSDAATLKHYRLLLAEVRGVAEWAEQLRQARYESVHAANFLALWTALRPDSPPPPIPSAAWGELGFQGKDPATDLRGSGLAGVACLLFFAENFPDAARRALLQASHPQHWMPFACAGINLTAFLLRDLLGAPDSPAKRPLAPHLLHHGTTPEQLRVVFCYLLVELCDAYSAAAPANVMAFPGIMAAFQERIRKQLATEGVLFRRLSDTRLVSRLK